MSTKNLYPETVDTMTRYNYLEGKEAIPVGQDYLQWVHLLYADGVSLDTLRTHIAARGFNTFEIDLILEYIDQYVRVEMGVDPDNSRSEYEQGLLIRCNKLANQASYDLTVFINQGVVAKTDIIDGCSYVVTSAILSTWQAVLNGTWTETVIPDLGSFTGVATRQQLEALVSELSDRLAQVGVTKTKIDQMLQEKKADVDIQFLATYDVVADFKSKLPWLE